MTDDQRIQVSEQEFKSLENKDRDWILLKTFTSQAESCDKRFCKLESRKKVNTAIASGSGFLGGFMAFFAKWLFLK